MLAWLARTWWVVALRGVLAIIFGILAFIWPGATVAALVLVFAAYALVDGIVELIAAFQGNNEHRWALVLEGVVSIIAGVVAFVWPTITALALLTVIAVWAIATGILEIIAAIQLRREITGEWALILSGIASIIFGALLIALPLAGLLTLAWLIGSYALVFGVLLIVLAFRLRSLRETTSTGRQRTA